MKDEWNRDYWKEIQTANESITGMDIKGKQYALVNERVTAFRSVFPLGTIETTVDYIQGEVGDRFIGMTAKVFDSEGKLLATGHAEERESFSYINKTSFIENCETSAIGRALGFCGYGIATSIASKEEVENAINNQGKVATVKQIDAFRLGYTENERARIRQYYGKNSDEELAQDIVKQYIETRKDEIAKRKKERDERTQGLDISTEQEMKPY